MVRQLCREGCALYVVALYLGVIQSSFYRSLHRVGVEPGSLEREVETGARHPLVGYERAYPHGARVEVAHIGILVQHGVVLQAGVTLQVADKAVEIEEGFAVSQAPVQRGVEVDSAHAADDVGGFHGDRLRMLHGGEVVIVGVKTVDDGIDGGAVLQCWRP